MADEAVKEHLPKLESDPKLRLHLDDVSHPSTTIFLALVDGSRLLQNSINHVLRNLYKPCNTPHIPPIRSVTLVLRPMGGVAYTTGLELDHLHKEIHFSLEHIKNVSKEPLRCRDEIIGVVTHEMVHVLQWNCKGSAPGGLIEGIADFVRLKAGLAPPHWRGAKDEIGEHWDDGYQKTAYFLDWLEDRHGSGTIAKMNQTMYDCDYVAEEFWPGLFGDGNTVDHLWKKYRHSFADDKTSTHSLDSDTVIVEKDSPDSAQTNIGTQTSTGRQTAVGTQTVVSLCSTTETERPLSASDVEGGR